MHSDAPLKFLSAPDGEKIAYKIYNDPENINAPTLIWCGGLKSDMEGGKATYLHDWAIGQGLHFIRFDYFGHGESTGDFPDGTMSRWSDDTVQVIDELSDGKVILIGSSMGGWAALLAALDRPEKTAALVLINPAPDFTEKLTVANWTEAQIKALENDGVVYEPSGYEEPYVYSKALIDDGRARQILDAPIELSCPIRILSGLEDSVVPTEYAFKLMSVLQSDDVAFIKVEGGDHSLSRPEDLSLITKAIQGVAKQG